MSILGDRDCRPGHRCPIATQKEAFHCDVHHGPRPIPDLAALTGISPKTLYKFANPFEEHEHISTRHLPVLLPHLTHHRLLDFYERLAGRLAFVVPTRDAGDAEIARTVREFAEFLTADTEAAADHCYTPEEFAHLEREADEALAQIKALVESRRRRVVVVHPHDHREGRR